ncbi:hypothetical protein [Massilia sp. Root418]|jgi:hypothetical protein|uniref:hypothetical protein n=1 Tax=Massilia sp. Root418 TaxID=1736532 RepID=UPI000A76C4F8|nr:hypothetical protein [Massilia sp. Root418]
MAKQKSGSGSKQSSAGSGSKQSAVQEEPKAGKDAASHTKAGSDKGKGGGAKQQRKH